jgi:hypothetical protein
VYYRSGVCSKGGEVAGFDNSQNVKNEPRLAAGRPREHLQQQREAAIDYVAGAETRNRPWNSVAAKIGAFI